MSAQGDSFVSPLDGVVSPENQTLTDQQQNEDMEASEQFFTPLQSTPSGSLHNQSVMSNFQSFNNQKTSSVTPQIFQNDDVKNQFNSDNQLPWKQFMAGQIEDSINILQNKSSFGNTQNTNNEEFINRVFENQSNQSNQQQKYVEQSHQQQFLNQNNNFGGNLSYGNKSQSQFQEDFEVSLFRSEYSQQQQQQQQGTSQRRSTPYSINFQQERQKTEVFDEQIFQQNQQINSRTNNNKFQNFDRNNSIATSSLFNGGLDSASHIQSALKLPDNIQILENSTGKTERDLTDLFLDIQQQQQQIGGDQNVILNNHSQGMAVDCESDDDDFKCVGGFVLYSPEELQQQKQTELMDMYDQEMQRIKGLQKQAQEIPGVMDTGDPYKNFLCHMLKNKNFETPLPKNLPSPVPVSSEKPQQGVNLNLMKTPQKQIKTLIPVPHKKREEGMASPGIQSWQQKSSIMAAPNELLKKIMATPVELRKMVQAVEEAVENLEINSGDADDSGKNEKLEEWLEELGIVDCIGHDAKDKLKEVWQGLDEAEKLRSTLEQLKQAELELAAESQKEFDRRVQLLHEENVGLEKQNEVLRKQLECFSGQEGNYIQNQRQEWQNEEKEQQVKYGENGSEDEEEEEEEEEEEGGSDESCEQITIENSVAVPSPSIGLLSAHLKSAADAAAGILSVLGQRQAPEDPEPCPPQLQTPPPRQSIETQTSSKKETPYNDKKQDVIDSTKRDQDSIPSFQGSSSKDKCSKSFIETHKQLTERLKTMHKGGLPIFHPWGGGLRHTKTIGTTKGEKQQPYPSPHPQLAKPDFLKVKNQKENSKLKVKAEVKNDTQFRQKHRIPYPKYLPYKENTLCVKKKSGNLSENDGQKQVEAPGSGSGQGQGQGQGSKQKQRSEQGQGQIRGITSEKNSSKLHRETNNQQFKSDLNQALQTGAKQPPFETNGLNSKNIDDKIFKQQLVRKNVANQQFRSNQSQMLNQEGRLDRFGKQPFQQNYRSSNDDQQIIKQEVFIQEGGQRNLNVGGVQGGVRMYQQEQQDKQKQWARGQMIARPQYHKNTFYNQVQQGGIPSTNSSWQEAARIMQPLQHYPPQMYPTHVAQAHPFYQNPYPVLPHPPYTYPTPTLPPHTGPAQMQHPQYVDSHVDFEPTEWSKRGLPAGIVKAVDEALADLKTSKDLSDYEYVLKPIKKVNKVNFKNKQRHQNQCDRFQRDSSEQSFYYEQGQGSAKGVDESSTKKSEQENVDYNYGSKDKKKKKLRSSKVLRKAVVLGIKLDEN